MNFTKTLFLIVAAFVLSGSINAQTSQLKRLSTSQKQIVTQCLTYDNSKVVLRGQLLRRNVVNASKQKETIWIMKLVAPICVQGDANNEFNVAVENVTDVQLVLTPRLYKIYKSQLNKTVTLDGTLFSAHTQHHFTKVLLEVEDLKGN